MMQGDWEASPLIGTRYVSLTTLRGDGTPVATPVWQITRGDTMWVWTGATTGKARRLRRIPPSLWRPVRRVGSSPATPVAAVGQVIPVGDAPEMFAALRRKYGWQMRSMMALHRFQHRVLRRLEKQYVLLRISLPSVRGAEAVA